MYVMVCGPILLADPESGKEEELNEAEKEEKTDVVDEGT